MYIYLPVCIYLNMLHELRSFQHIEKFLKMMFNQKFLSLIYMLHIYVKNLLHIHINIYYKIQLFFCSLKNSIKSQKFIAFEKCDIMYFYYILTNIIFHIKRNRGEPHQKIKQYNNETESSELQTLFYPSFILIQTSSNTLVKLGKGSERT